MNHFSRSSKKENGGRRSKHDFRDSDEDENEEDDNDDDTKEEVLPKGLVTWREGVRQATTAAQVAMAFYVLETSIAWHKSIMKAYCQLCHLGDNESSLLLCDGCDKGYHTYCFKPVLTNVPEGDWYCYECINKATGAKHCLVCGNQGGKNLISCATCPRAYHIDCLSPQLSKVSGYTPFQAMHQFDVKYIASITCCHIPHSFNRILKLFAAKGIYKKVSNENGCNTDPLELSKNI